MTAEATGAAATGGTNMDVRQGGAARAAGCGMDVPAW